MRKKMLVLSFSLIAMFTWSVTAAIGADMFTGTWKENIAKSTYTPGPPPKNATTAKYTAVDNGLKRVSDGVNATGQKTHTESTAKFDGKDYPSNATLDGKPSPNSADMVSVKKVDDYTIEFTYKLKGKVTTSGKVVVSKDGKTETVTQTGTNAQGQAVSNTVVFEKQ